MVPELNAHIGECLTHAADAASRAEQLADERTKQGFVALARRWNHLADSFQFAESLDHFLYGRPPAADGWQPASSAPTDRRLELAVIDWNSVHVLVFPCCRAADGWIEARTMHRIDVAPTHWREWVESNPPDRPSQTTRAAEDAPDRNALVILEREDASVQVAYGDNGLFELVVTVRGDEVTAYDLDRDRLATIGRRLLTLAGKADRAAARRRTSKSGAAGRR